MISDTEPWLHLASGVMRQAVIDARAGDRCAVKWLLSDDSLLIACLLGIDFDKIRSTASKWGRPGALIIRLFTGV